MPVGHLYVFFGEMAIRSSYFRIVFFFFFILSCMNALCILDVNPLLIVSFANIFSHSAGCIFIFFMVSFAAEKLLSLIKSC